jgi:ribosome-binding factor A
MKRVSNRRPERVAALIKETIAGALTGKVKDPRVGFVTVTSVSVSKDVSVASIMLSVLGDESEKESALEGMASARGFLRTMIARKLDLRVAPELRFKIDRGLEYSARIDELLSEDNDEGSSN